MIFEPLTRIKRHYGNMRDIHHGYAMTVHKSQGSDWSHSICFIDYSSKPGSFLNCSLLNTMLTRARESVTCIGDPFLFVAASLQSPPLRYDRLAVRIVDLINN